ncbi:MAG: pyridoxal-dependent decarboxylase, partial [Gammaproteobacteria bacterium]
MSRIIPYFMNAEIPKIGQTPMAYLNDMRNRPKEALGHSPQNIGEMSGRVAPDTSEFIAHLIKKNYNVAKAELAMHSTAKVRQVQAMMHKLVFKNEKGAYNNIQDSSKTYGIMTSGGSVANATALHVCLNTFMPNANSEGVKFPFEKNGKTYNQFAVVASEATHYSVASALGQLGLGKKSVISVSTDRNGHVIVSEMKKAFEKAESEGKFVMAFIGVGGATETGQVDPMGDIAELAHQHGRWFHADLCWGGSQLISSNKAVLKGVELADSASLDAQKGFALPVGGLGGGMVVFRDPSSANVIAKNAEYILKKGGHDLGSVSMEGSRPAAGDAWHYVLLTRGENGLCALTDEANQIAKLLAIMIQTSPKIDLMMQPDTSVVSFRYLPQKFQGIAPQDLTTAQNNEIDHFNKALQEQVVRGGKSFVSITVTHDNRNSSRPCVSTFRAPINTGVTEEGAVAALNDILE